MDSYHQWFILGLTLLTPVVMGHTFLFEFKVGCQCHFICLLDNFSLFQPYDQGVLSRFGAVTTFFFFFLSCLTSRSIPLTPSLCLCCESWHWGRWILLTLHTPASSSHRCSSNATNWDLSRTVRQSNANSPWRYIRHFLFLSSLHSCHR